MSNTGLATAVQDALMRHTPLRIWLHSISVDTHDSTIVLSGIVRSHAAKETAAQLARGVKGVNAVHNQIVVDDDIEVAVAQALAADPVTRDAFPGILVGVVFGVVYLKGTVASAEIKNAAGEVAREVSAVKRVSNELVVVAA